MKGRKVYEMNKKKNNKNNIINPFLFIFILTDFTYFTYIPFHKKGAKEKKKRSSDGIHSNPNNILLDALLYF